MANTVPDERPGNETGIRRPRVESILAEALQKPLAVLQGGAGFGKPALPRIIWRDRNIVLYGTILRPWTTIHPVFGKACPLPLPCTTLPWRKK